MTTIRYIQTDNDSPKEIYCEDNMLFETVSLIEKVVHEYKVYQSGITLTPKVFGWGDMSKWVERFHYEETDWYTEDVNKT